VKKRLDFQLYFECFDLLLTLSAICAVYMRSEKVSALTEKRESREAETAPRG